MRFPQEEQKSEQILLRQLLRGEMGAIAACFTEIKPVRTNLP